jgi:sirohydrochlorin cobaltochelatase
MRIEFYGQIQCPFSIAYRFLYQTMTNSLISIQRQIGTLLSTDHIMNDYIILTAFGTTTRAKAAYQFLQSRIAPKFPDCHIHWAFSSPTVRRGSKSAATRLASVTEIISQLRNPGRVVIQSLHVLAGHEFDRIATEATALPVPTALGMPLLHGPSDFDRVAQALKDLISASGQEAALVLGHGTDHPCRASYSTLAEILRDKIGPRVFFSTIEKPVDPPELIIRRIHQAGYRKVFCVPFLLVAGMHFRKDINGDHESSWRNLLMERQIEIDLHDQGLAYLPGVDDIFCDHITAAFGSLDT